MRDRGRGLGKVLYLILSVIISVGLWFFVDEQSQRLVTVTVEGIPVEYTGQDALADSGLMLIAGEGSGTDEHIDITFRGARRHVVQLERSDVRVTADLSSVKAPGVQTVRPVLSFTDQKKFSFTNTSVYEQSFETATVHIGELSRKDVEVRCELSGSVADGYTAGKVQMSKTVIALRGQEEDIEKVHYAKVVFNIDEDVKETVTALLDYRLCGENGEILDLPDIHADEGPIQVTLPVYVTKELKLKMDFLEAPGARLRDMEYHIQPESIMVSGDAGILNGMDSITLDSFDLTTVGRDSASHSYGIVVPDGCENLSGVTRATLEIRCPEKTTAEILVTTIILENAPANRSVELLTTELSVQIFGTAAAVETVHQETLAAVVDLSDYAVATGTYMVPVRLQIGDGVSVGVSGTYKVQIRIPGQDG